MTVRTGKQRAIVAVMLFAILIAAAVVLVRGLRSTREPPSPSARGEAPPRQSAARFLDSVGVNVHVTYLDTSYGRMDSWLARLRELGVHHVRDGITLGNASTTGRLRALADAGMRLTLITDLNHGADEQVAYAATFGRAVDAIEAPNEADVTGPPDWAARLQRFLPELRAAVDAHGPPSKTIVGPSFVKFESWKQIGGVTGSWDVTNLHSYPAGQEPSANLEQQLAFARQQGPQHAIEATETGYHNALRARSGQPPVSEAAAATYIPRMALTYFAAGIKRTFLYELADQKPNPGLWQPELHFGLLRDDLTPKPAFNALRNLLRVVRGSDGPGEPRGVRVEAPAGVHRLLLERDDGSSVLALWQSTSAWNTDTRTAQTVRPLYATLRFGSAAKDLTVKRPSLGAQPIARREKASSLLVRVPSDVVLVSYR